MRFQMLFVGALLGLTSAAAQEAPLLKAIVTPERAFAPIAQKLTGTWLMMGRRAAPPGQPIPPAAPVFLMFHEDGTLTGASTSGDSSFSGVWLRVADRKFLVTYFAFNFNEARAFVSIAKIRLTTTINADGTALSGNQEVLVTDPEGKVMFTALGGTHQMVRVAAEKPADFDAFLAKPLD